MTHLRSIFQVRRDPRINLKETNISIRNVTVWDSGFYSCQVESDQDEPLSITHHLMVLGESLLGKVLYSS